MKNDKRFAAALLAVLAALLLPVRAMAAEARDPDRAVSLTISYLDHGAPLSGAEFSLYQVADIDENGALTPTAAFAALAVDLQGKDDAAWKALGTTLAAYAAGVDPTDSGTTDGAGELCFPTAGKTLPQGLYLVVGARHTQDGKIYDAQPFLAMLPELDREADAWVYDAAARPKHEARPAPGEGDTVTRKVLKVWQDEGHEAERPQSVEVQLWRDGELYDTATLDGGGGWSFAWTGLDARYRWSVTETVPAGYTVQIAQEGITVVVTNTHSQQGPLSPTPGPDRLPQTGQLWWPVPLLLALGLLCLAAGLLARRRGEK